MTTSLPNRPSRSQRAGGFTLVELMIATSLGTIVLAGVLATFMTLVRSGVRASNYSVMETQTRRAFEQMGIDSRMASGFSSNISGGAITSFTLTIPNNDLTAVRQVTYGYDTSVSTNKRFFFVPGADPTATAGRLDLVTGVEALSFLRYDATDTLIPTSTTSDALIKHIQVSVSVSRATTGVVKATQIIRSSAFTIRNISI
ncbi:MAG TPA: prepilin-type N-terminal cleavage/methylation domain-containing protein [Opitutaceae bacterium]|nr:prepilin-type N-terminal cleavage/methylation domain-containing protein [Opitutaceae bacterium]